MKAGADFDSLPDLLRVEEVIQLCRCGRNQAYHLIAIGKIPSVRFGRSIRILKAELLRVITEGTPTKNATGEASPAARGGGRRERPTPE